tara:strand:+ start:33677 stop:34462 length:786 start_codon:yes stop_codon:yes gene_type:complete
MTIRTFISTAFILVLGGCASTPEAPEAPSFQAPWAEHGRPEFRDLLVSYGTTNLQLRRDEALDFYLRSQTKTFDRYVAAKEVGVGIEALQDEAIAEIQSLAPTLRTKQFLVRTEFPVYGYDQQLQGFPLYEDPFDLRAGVRYTNDDVRTGISDGRRTRGMAVISSDYGFTNAQVQFSKEGWVIPATPDQAVRMLEQLSQVGGKRSIAVALTYSLDRCEADESQRSNLICTATIQNMYGYSSLNSVQPDTPPTMQLVRRGRR